MKKFIGAGIIILTAVLVYGSQPSAQSNPPPKHIPLDQIPRIYGLSVTAPKSPHLLLATPMGLYLAKPEGMAEMVPRAEGFVMGFAVQPGKPGRMVMGGHPGKTGSLGLMLSTDGGGNWEQISPTAAGITGFHILEYSKADSNTIYGLTDTLRVSKDGGRSWTEAGVVPKGLIGFAASAKQVKTVYAATRGGLLISRDQGATWQPTTLPRAITTMVHVTPQGRVLAFVLGAGLMAAQEPKLVWKPLASNVTGDALVRMTLDPGNPQRWYATTGTGGVVTSADGGKTWIGYEGSHLATPKIIAQGKKLFNAHCKVCHGEDGKGQRTTPGFDPNKPPPIAAPALDDSDHGWHHSDTNLLQTILQGSPLKGSPMVGWKGKLSESDGRSLVAYIKSLWSFRSISCQGARHMSCMRHQ